MEYYQFKNRVSEVLGSFVPNSTIPSTMSPFQSKDRLQALHSNPNPRLSSVMIMVFNREGIAHFSLIRRPEYDGHHSGQISFPGGKMEKEDFSLKETALRETNEEIGVGAGIEIMGTISNVYIPPSKFLVTPYIGFSDIYPSFKKDDFEVAEILEVPVSLLMREDIVKTGTVTIGSGMRLKVPYFDVFGHMVWGATAIILDEFKQIVK